MTHQDDFWYSVDNSRGFTFFIIEYSATTIVFFLTFYLFFVRKLWFKINESLYIALFAVSESIKKLLSIHCVSIYLFSTFFSMDFTQWKSVGLPNTAWSWLINSKPFLSNVPILNPLKTPKNQKFSGVFRGYKMGTLAGNRLLILSADYLHCNNVIVGLIYEHLLSTFRFPLL